MAQLPEPPLPAATKEAVHQMPEWKQQWLRLLFYELLVLVLMLAAGVFYFIRAVIVKDGNPISYAGIFIINGAILGAIFHRLRHIREDLRTYRGG